MASVGRRLLVRVSALGAVAGAAVGAGGAIAMAPPPLVRVGLVLVCAASGAVVARRLARGAQVADGTAWLDRRAGRVELIASGVAVAEGRARRTALASAVLGSATERARAIARPSRSPIVLAIATVLVLTALTWTFPRAERARPATTAPTQPRVAVIVARDGGDRGPLASNGGTQAQDGAATATAPAVDGEPASNSASAGSRALLAGRGADTSGLGGTAGGAIDGEPTITPAATTTQLDIDAPRAGASAAVSAVPPRYRALVAAYLEAR